MKYTCDIELDENRTDCSSCPLCNCEDYCNLQDEDDLHEYDDTWEYQLSNCPLKTIDPHIKDLIECDKPPENLISYCKSTSEDKIIQILTDGNNSFDDSYCRYTNIKTLKHMRLRMNNFDCKLSSIMAMCLKDGIQRQEDCVEQCDQYNKCGWCTWEETEYCERCINNVNAKTSETKKSEERKTENE